VTHVPTVSLVLATAGRGASLERFLAALARQRVRDFELLVVEQGIGDDLDPIVGRYASQLTIRRLRSAPGASIARNVGLRAVRGRIVAFPDDDCWYPDDLLERVTGAFEAHPEWAGLVGRAADESGDAPISRWSRSAGTIDRFNVWWRGITPTTFLRHEVVRSVGGFDERLGPGSPAGFSGADDTEYLIRVVRDGSRVHYDPSLVVYHPDPPIDASLACRAYSYGRSMGSVLRRYRYPPWFVCYVCVRPLAGAAVALARGQSQRARFHWSAFRGRLSGVVHPHAPKLQTRGVLPHERRSSS
jgi:glycosyltransferase involved in cell wall biosynthesis